MSLTAPRAGDTPSGQKALVLSFAALTVAGGAYLGTMLMLHDSESVTNLLAPAEATAARAVAAPAAPAIAAAAPAAVAPAPVVPAAPKAVEAVAEPAPASPAQPPAPAAVQLAAAALPAPTKVSTIKVLPKTTVQPAATLQPSATDVSDVSSAAPDENADLPADAGSDTAAAYVPETRAMLSQGVEAIMREMSDNKKLRPVQVAVRSDDADDNDAPATVSGRQGRIRTAVNLRSRPADGSHVIAVIPTNATVSVAPGCKAWCRISFKGQSGYIYKGFLR